MFNAEADEEALPLVKKQIIMPAFYMG